MRFNFEKRGQLSIFVIIAIALVAVLTIFMVVWKTQGPEGGTSTSNSVLAYYEQCLARETRDALSIAGTQGGYITPPAYIPGSDYAPFSSQLDFLGFPVPYWQYISSNGVIKEQVPRKSDIEQALARYLESSLLCDFSSFADRGIAVDLGTPRIKVKIEDERVLVENEQEIRVTSESGSTRYTRQNIQVPSKFGALYRQAIDVYSFEQKTTFLENYSSDVLYLYAPVDGVETSCAPKLWKTREVVSGLQEGLAANIGAIKMKGDYYTLQNEEDKYFVVDHRVEDQVRFLYSPNWPSRVEITGAGQERMIAEPVGLQAGLGVLGFCYAPYHFVYDVEYPVLVQISNDEEVFQFPVVVIIDNNLPRQSIATSLTVDSEATDLCEYSTQSVNVDVRDVTLSPIEKAEVSYACFDQTCSLGTTANGATQGMVPSCANGYLSVKAEGYAPQRQLFSSVSETQATLILDRLYSLDLEVMTDGRTKEDGLTLISFEGPESTTVAYPEVLNVTLPEGYYNITVYVYGNASVTIPASTSRECQSVPRSGFSGIFGGTREHCYDIVLPETKVDRALVGGGSVSAYLLPAELEKGTLELRVPSLPRPETLAQLQTNYEAFSLQRVEVLLK